MVWWVSLPTSHTSLSFSSSKTTTGPLHIVVARLEGTCLSLFAIRKFLKRGNWVAQYVECPTSAQVMILQFMSSSPILLMSACQYKACFRSSVSLLAPPPPRGGGGPAKNPCLHSPLQKINIKKRERKLAKITLMKLHPPESHFNVHVLREKRVGSGGP